MPILRWTLTALFTIGFFWLSFRQIERNERKEQNQTA